MDRVRRVLRLGVADCLRGSGLLRANRFLRRRILGKKEVCVLGLHRILRPAEQSRTKSLGSIVLKEETFATMLEYLSRHYKVVSPENLLAGTSIDPGDRRPCCVLTFDDGWRDNYTTAYPWLRRFGLTASVFVVTGMIESRDVFWVERLAREWQDSTRRGHIASELGTLTSQKAGKAGLKAVVEYLKRMSGERRQEILARLFNGDSDPALRDSVDQMMNWDQIGEMSRNGIDFGAHTVTHPLLPYEADKTVERELLESKATLEAKLGKQVRAFAYPNGDWDERVRKFVQQASYSCAFTTRAGWYCEGDDPYTIRRILIHEGNVTGWDGRFSPAAFTLTLARGG
jgi:peptidoglycan/xylan/chitin deacetylase (PgdA/CDA1 family)